MGTLLLRMPAGTPPEEDSDPSAMLDDDATTAWVSTQPMVPGQAVIIDRSGFQGSGRYSNMIDADPASKWSTAKNMVPGQAIVIDRGDPVRGIGDPANMIDGDLTSRWTSGANMKPGMAVIIDRGDGFLSRLFNQVLMESSAAHPDEYARSFTVSVSDDQSSWHEVYSGGGLTATIVSGKFPSRLERYVKITQTGTASHWWTLAEVRLLYNTGVVHDVDRSNWQLSISGIVANLPSFNRLVLNSGSATDDYARTFTVQVSDDNTSWDTVISGTGITAVSSIAFPSQRARYIKVKQTSSAPHPWTLADVALFNVGSGDAETILDRSGWVLDVEGSVGGLPEFNQIVMQSGTAPGYARSFTVYVSADARTWTQVTSGAGASGAIASAQFPARKDRYIKIVQNSTSPYFWTLTSVTARMDSAILNRETWEVVSVPTAAAVHDTDYWLPLSVNGEGVIGSDPAAAVDSSPGTQWASGGPPVMSGQMLVINRGSDPSIFDTVLVDFGGALSGESGFNYTTSKNGTRFQVLVSVDGIVWRWVATAFASQQFFAAHFSPEATRYIQIALMDPLLAPWTVANINLFNGEASLPRTGWTVSAPYTAGTGWTERGLLQLNTKDNGWVRCVPPGAPDAHPLKLRLKDKSWHTVMHLGQPDGTPAPFMVTYSRDRGYQELAGTQTEFVQNYVLPDYDADVRLGSQGYMLQAASSRADTWIREPINGNPVGQQVRTSKYHSYFNSTLWVTDMDYVKQYWLGYPVTKLRFGFQIQQYHWDTTRLLEGSPRGTVTLFRHSSPLPTFGQPALPGTGTPIHTFGPVEDGLPDIRILYRSRGDVPLRRGEMFWYEIDPVWTDLAFSLRTSWEISGTTIPVTEPGITSSDLPGYADGFYQYAGEDYALVKVVFQVVTD